MDLRQRDHIEARLASYCWVDRRSTSSYVLAKPSPVPCHCRLALPDTAISWSYSFFMLLSTSSPSHAQQTASETSTDFISVTFAYLDPLDSLPEQLSPITRSGGNGSTPDRASPITCVVDIDSHQLFLDDTSTLVPHLHQLATLTLWEALSSPSDDVPPELSTGSD